MDWSQLATMVERQLHQQLAVFVEKISAQEVEIRLLRAQITALESQQQNSRSPIPNTSSNNTSSASDGQRTNAHSDSSTALHGGTSKIASVLPALAAAPPSPNPSLSSSEYQQARMLSQLLEQAGMDTKVAALSGKQHPTAIAEGDEHDIKHHTAGTKRSASPSHLIKQDQEEPNKKKAKLSPTSTAALPVPHSALALAMQETQSLESKKLAPNSPSKPHTRPTDNISPITKVTANSVIKLERADMAHINTDEDQHMFDIPATPSSSIPPINAIPIPARTPSNSDSKLTTTKQQQTAVTSRIISPLPPEPDMKAQEAYEQFGGSAFVPEDPHANDHDEEMPDAAGTTTGSNLKLELNSSRAEAISEVTRNPDGHDRTEVKNEKISATELVNAIFPNAPIPAAAPAATSSSHSGSSNSNNASSTATGASAPTPPAPLPSLPADVKSKGEALAAQGFSFALKHEWEASLGKLNEAIDLLSTIHWKHVPVVWLKQRSTVHAKMGANSAAYVDAAKMMEHHETNWNGYFIHSTLLGRDKKYDQALIECKKAWKLALREKDNEADRKKIRERIRQLESKLHLPPCDLSELLAEDDTAKDVAQQLHASPPTTTTEEKSSGAELRTPQQPKAAAHSPTSSTAATVTATPVQNKDGALTTNNVVEPRKLDFQQMNKAPAAATPSPTSTSTSTTNSAQRVIFGTYKLQGSACQQSLVHAFRTGFRRIDTGGSYSNEEIIGKVLTSTGIPRSQVSITSKISWNDMGSEEQAYAAAIASLKKLDVAYIDCMLIHFPGRPKTAYNSTVHAAARTAVWKALERLVSEGRAKAIGVSNFEVKHLQQILSSSKLKPKCNQIELHPLLYQTQKPIIEFCQSRNIEIEAYSPLGMGKSDLLNQPLLAAIAKQSRRSIVEVLVQWSMQHGFIPIVKSTSPLHMKENLSLALSYQQQPADRRFTLTDSQMYEIDQMEKTIGKHRFAWDPSKFN